MSKMLRTPFFIVMLLTAACGASRSGDVLVDVGNTGVGLADGIHELQKGVSALSPNPIPATKGREMQQALLKANAELMRLPDFLVAADAARKVGQVEPGKIEETLAIVGSIADQMDIVIQGFDVGDVAKKMLKLASETRVTAVKIQLGLAQLKAEMAKE